MKCKCKAICRDPVGSSLSTSAESHLSHDHQRCDPPLGCGGRLLCAPVCLVITGAVILHFRLHSYCHSSLSAPVSTASSVVSLSSLTPLHCPWEKPPVSLGSEVMPLLDLNLHAPQRNAFQLGAVRPMQTLLKHSQLLRILE